MDSSAPNSLSSAPLHQIIAKEFRSSEFRFTKFVDLKARFTKMVELRETTHLITQTYRFILFVFVDLLLIVHRECRPCRRKRALWPLHPSDWRAAARPAPLTRLPPPPTTARPAIPATAWLPLPSPPCLATPITCKLLRRRRPTNLRLSTTDTTRSSRECHPSPATDATQYACGSHPATTLHSMLPCCRSRRRCATPDW
jgi:hypothetical protein